MRAGVVLGGFEAESKQHFALDTSEHTAAGPRAVSLVWRLQLDAIDGCRREGKATNDQSWECFQTCRASCLCETIVLCLDCESNGDRNIAGAACSQQVVIKAKGNFNHEKGNILHIDFKCDSPHMQVLSEFMVPPLPLLLSYLKAGGKKIRIRSLKPCAANPALRR